MKKPVLFVAAALTALAVPALAGEVCAGKFDVGTPTSLEVRGNKVVYTFGSGQWVQAYGKTTAGNMTFLVGNSKNRVFTKQLGGGKIRMTWVAGADDPARGIKKGDKYQATVTCPSAASAGQYAGL